MSIVSVATDHRFADFRAIRVRLNYKSPRPIQIAFLAPNHSVIAVEFAAEDFASFPAFSDRCTASWLVLADDAITEFPDLKQFVEKIVLAARAT